MLSADTYLGNIGNPLSLNLYTYCANNPLKYVDPSGHSYERLPTSGSGMTQAQININSAYNAMNGGWLSYENYAKNVILNGGTPVANPSSTSSSTAGSSTSSKPEDNAYFVSGLGWFENGTNKDLWQDPAYKNVYPGGTLNDVGGSGSSSESKAAPPLAPEKPKWPDGQTETGNRILTSPKSSGNVDVVINGTTINYAVLINSSVWGNAKEITSALGFSYNTAVNAAYINGKWVQAPFVDNNYVFLVRDMARLAGIEDCLSWWSDSTGFHVLVDKDLKNAPVKITRQGNDFTSTAYLEFSGNSGQPFPGTTAIASQGYSYAQIVADGIARYWSTPSIGASSAYDFDGKAITVQTNVIIKNPNQNYGNQKFVFVEIANITTSGTDKMTNAGANSWTVAGDKNVYLHPINAATVDEFMRIAGHEFGHVVGIGDAYVLKDTQANAEVPYADFMRYANNPYSNIRLYVSANDIEMMWEAYRTNTWQSFESKNRSTVIRSIL